jgi:hypothetical protein
VPASIDTPNVEIVALFHAEGAQIYKCSRDASQKLAWKAREPIATLISEGTTVGRHYAGPTSARCSTARPSVLPSSGFFAMSETALSMTRRAGR